MNIGACGRKEFSNGAGGEWLKTKADYTEGNSFRRPKHLAGTALRKEADLAQALLVKFSGFTDISLMVVNHS